MNSSTLTDRRDRPAIDIAPNRAVMGERAALHVIGVLQATLAAQRTARVMFACAPSQDDFLASLVRLSVPAIEWSRVTVFHMDEYVGLASDHPASFRNYLRTHLLEPLPQIRTYHLIGGDAHDRNQECLRYAALLNDSPLDLICLGIGENGHIAFNDPPVADFDDPFAAKIVELDESCRRQQVNDGCFSTIETVPTHAITVTIPVFRRARHVSVVVPGPRKASAVRATVRDPLSTRCPATILRTHPNSTLFLDRDSAAQLG